MDTTEYHNSLRMKPSQLLRVLAADYLCVVAERAFLYRISIPGGVAVDRGESGGGELRVLVQ